MMTMPPRTTWSAYATLLLAIAGVQCEFIASVDRSQIGTTGAGASTGLGGSAIGDGGSSGSGGTELSDGSLDDVSDPGADMGVAGSGGGTGGTIQPDETGTGLTDADGGPTDGPVPVNDSSVCGGTLPPGWSLAVYNPTSGACPTSMGFAEHSVFGPATVGSAACSCTCAVTQAGACDQGTLVAAIAPGSGNDACVMPWISTAISGPGCVTAGGGEDFDHVQAVQLAPRGGTCSGTAHPDPTQVTKPAQRYCDVPSTNSDAVCAGTAPTGFFACIVASGTTTCPSGSRFSHAYYVEDDVAVNCSACSACSVSTACSNAMVSIYSDTNCATLVSTFAANGTCVDTNPNEDSISSITYSATATSSCVAGASTGTTQPVGPRTICCQ